MHLRTGTSGFAYKEWIGPFYPEGTPEKELLPAYAARLDTVEINNSFHRFPTTASLAPWLAKVPPDFQFAFKAPQRITHQKRLREVDEELSRLFDVLNTLGPRLGPVLFQLPPRMPLNLDALRDLLTCLPPGTRAAFEFRDERWHTDAVRELLTGERAALCHNDDLAAPLHPTTDWGYLRLRRETYSDDDLRAAAEQLLRQPWHEAYIFVKHEAPDSPLLALRFRDIAQCLAAAS